MSTLLLTFLICGGLFAALVYSGKLSQPAYAHDRGHPRYECGDRCKQLRERMWGWYRTSGFRCIREHEASWHDPNAPYWGGVQADMNFQRAYGRGLEGGSYLRKWSTAERWPHFRQIHMAYRGHKARGFSPWPNTARICGLL